MRQSAIKLNPLPQEPSLRALPTGDEDFLPGGACFAYYTRNGEDIRRKHDKKNSQHGGRQAQAPKLICRGPRSVISPRLIV
jgi:hypothetical protein